ncbi:MAG: hypothetical protein F4X61_08685 [Rhodothermaceae bacterium]|nr:hypothetical protein [Rhodothermaceae bacterium]
MDQFGLAYGMSDNNNQITIGHYDQEGNACVYVHICGTKHEHPGVKFEGIIDTGFTGFLQLPLSHATVLALPLEGIQKIGLANASTSTMLTVLADVTLADKTETGISLVSETSNTILLGMDFLRRFDRVLMISKGGVVLLDEPFLKESNKGD